MSVQDTVSGVDLSGSHYVVKQALIRNKYEVQNDQGEVILRAKQRLFKMKEEFPFVDANDDPIFRIKAGGILDFAGDYSIIDEATETPIAILEKEFTLLAHKWKIRDPQTDEIVARIESSGVMELIRNLPYIGLITQFIPHTYEILDPHGNPLGEISGRLSLKDTYDITIEETGNAPRESLVVAAIAIDALEGN